MQNHRFLTISEQHFLHFLKLLKHGYDIWVPTICSISHHNFFLKDDEKALYYHHFFTNLGDYSKNCCSLQHISPKIVGCGILYELQNYPGENQLFAISDQFLKSNRKKQPSIITFVTSKDYKIKFRRKDKKILVINTVCITKQFLYLILGSIPIPFYYKKNEQPDVQKFGIIIENIIHQQILLKLNKNMDVIIVRGSNLKKYISVNGETFYLISQNLIKLFSKMICEFKFNYTFLFFDFS